MLKLYHEISIFEMSISLMFRAPLGRKASGALCGFRGQPFAQSKRYHTIEYKLILYAKAQLSNRRMVEGIVKRIKHSFVEQQNAYMRGLRL